MRVPLSWLREMVDFDLEPEALAERLTLLGMEVKGIQRIGADWENVVVGELLEVGPHPGSSKLSLTKVRVGASHPVLSIVCGATNIEAGQRVPVALPGCGAARRTAASRCRASPARRARACSAPATSWASPATRTGS